MKPDSDLADGMNPSGTTGQASTPEQAAHSQRKPRRRLVVAALIFLLMLGLWLTRNAVVHWGVERALTLAGVQATGLGIGSWGRIHADQLSWTSPTPAAPAGVSPATPTRVLAQGVQLDLGLRALLHRRIEFSQIDIVDLQVEPGQGSDQALTSLAPPVPIALDQVNITRFRIVGHDDQSPKDSKTNTLKSLVTLLDVRAALQADASRWQLSQLSFDHASADETAATSDAQAPATLASQPPSEPANPKRAHVVMQGQIASQAPFAGNWSAQLRHEAYPHAQLALKLSGPLDASQLELALLPSKATETVTTAPVRAATELDLLHGKPRAPISIRLTEFDPATWLAPVLATQADKDEAAATREALTSNLNGEIQLKPADLDSFVTDYTLELKLTNSAAAAPTDLHRLGLRALASLQARAWLPGKPHGDAKSHSAYQLHEATAQLASQSGQIRLSGAWPRTLTGAAPGPETSPAEPELTLQVTQLKLPKQAFSPQWQLAAALINASAQLRRSPSGERWLLSGQAALQAQAPTATSGNPTPPDQLKLSAEFAPPIAANPTWSLQLHELSLQPSNARNAIQLRGEVHGEMRGITPAQHQAASPSPPQLSDYQLQLSFTHYRLPLHWLINSNGTPASQAPALQALSTLVINGDLNGEFKPNDPASFAHNHRWQLQFNDSSWANRPLQVSGRVEANQQSLSLQRVLVSGALNLQADGSLPWRTTQVIDPSTSPASGQNIQLTLRSTDLSKLHPSLRGQLNAQAGLSHSLIQPWLTLQAQSIGLQELDSGLKTQRGQLQVALDPQHWLNAPETSALNPTRFELSFQNLEVQQQSFDQVQVQLKGDASAHDLEVHARGAEQSFTVALQGSLTPQSWLVQLKQVQAQLQRPSRRNPDLIQLAEPGPQVQFDRKLTQLSWQAFNLRLLDGELRLESGLWQPDQRLRLHGQLRQIALQALLPDGDDGTLRSTLRADGQLDVEIDQAHPSASRADMEIHTTSGDLQLLDPALALEIERATIQAQLLNARLQLQTHLRSKRYGRLDAELALPFDPATQSASALSSAAMQGQVVIDSPSLAWLPAITRGKVRAAGRLQADLKLTGTLAQPQPQGRIQLDKLELEHPESKLVIRQGDLSLRLANNMISLEDGRLKVGDGLLTLTGSAPLPWLTPPAASATDSASAGTLSLRALRVPLPAGLDQTLIVSGQGQLRVEGAMLVFDGRFITDEARLLLKDDNSPKLSEDIIVQRKASTPATAPSAEATRAWGLKAAVELQLGERFEVRSMSQSTHLQAKLNGQLLLNIASPGSMTARGKVQIKEGKVKAYGQELEVDRGNITFTGAIDNPVLDVSARRTDIATIRPGIALYGPARNSQVKLIADTNLSDSEKLSWLVLGRGINDGTANEQAAAALQVAAKALVGQSNTPGITEQISNALGLDAITLRSAPANAAGAIVTVGKKLSPRLFVAYEQSLRGVWNIVRLQYTLSRQWSIRAQAGSESAVDLQYSLPFD